MPQSTLRLDPINAQRHKEGVTLEDFETQRDSSDERKSFCNRTRKHLVQNRQAGTLFALTLSRASFGSPRLHRPSRQFKVVAQRITFVCRHPIHALEQWEQEHPRIVGTGCPQRSTVSYGALSGVASGLRYQLTQL
jgi:hypothetical protein